MKRANTELRQKVQAMRDRITDLEEKLSLQMTKTQNFQSSCCWLKIRNEELQQQLQSALAESCATQSQIKDAKIVYGPWRKVTKAHK